MSLRRFHLTRSLVVTCALCAAAALADEPADVPDGIVIDDFESYTDEYGQRMYETWIDGWTNGTGSLVGYVNPDGPLNIVHGGIQAMPLEYNNVDPPYYSEAYRTWEVAQDWTINNVADLSLWFRGWPPSFLETPDGRIVLSGSGYDTEEGCRYAWKGLMGDGEAVVRIDSFRGDTGWAGVMIREAVEPWRYPPTTKYAAVVITPNRGVSFLYRRAKDGQPEQSNVAGIHVPCWVRLTRRDDTFTARFSADGMTWQEVTDDGGIALGVSMPMPEAAYIGLAVTSGSYMPVVAEFSQPEFAGSISQSWQVTTINSGGLSNTPDTLYVAVEDAAGVVAVAANLGGVNVTEWTEWRIPLSAFVRAGVNLKSIKKMYIGIGDRNNPQRAGSGRVFIDDVCLLQRVRAADPYPPDADVNVPQSLTLRWSPGSMATHHDIYFGTDPNTVPSATPATAGIYRGRQAQDQTAFDPGRLERNTAYYWRVDEIDANGETHKGLVWTFRTWGAPGGVKAEYFNDWRASRIPVLVREEDSIDHNWGKGEVAAGLSDGVWARWTANLQIPVTGTYILITTTDEGVRLWLGGRLLIDNWTSHTVTDNEASVELQAGHVYFLDMDWYDGTGDAVAQLSWEGPSIPRQVIPPGPLQLPLRATCVYPPHEATDVAQTLWLLWSPAELATEYDVYFGEDANGIAEVTTTSRSYCGRQKWNSFPYAEFPSLEWNTTYYWRIDEVNDANPESPWKGPVWSFTTADFLMIDDFESYDERQDTGTRIYETWIDVWTDGCEWPFGMCATLANLERQIIHGGRQAMALDYNNVPAPWLSAVERDWSWEQKKSVNWTTKSVDTLVLFVRGRASNDPAPLYVTIEDSTHKVNTVVHPDPQLTLTAEWTEWRVPLSSLAGVNLANIKKMRIGVGDPGNPTPGGLGRIYIDDIRVIKSGP